MPSVDELIPMLIDGGVVTATEAVRGDMVLDPVGRSHPVFRLSVDGRARASVKLFEPRRGATDGEAATEDAVAALAETVPELRALVPARLPCPGAGLVVHRWIDGTAAWAGDSVAVAGGAEPGVDFDDLLARLLPPLAALHRATAGARPGFADGPPWGLRLFDGDAPRDVWENPFVRPLLERFGATPLIVRGTRRARAAWRPRCLVHGDLKHDNVVLRADGGVVLIDWEMARRGDPAWDLAALLARPLAGAGDDAWEEPTRLQAARLVAGYARAAGLPVAAVAQRVVLYASAWLVMTALQHVSALAGGAAPDVEAVLSAAGRGFAFEPDLTQAVIEAADAG